MQSGEQFSLWSGPSIEERFVSHRAHHPEVMDELVRLAYEAKAAGMRRIGIRMLWERMRWLFTVERDEGDFKLNDHLTSRYVRTMVREHPDLAPMFEVRELRAV